MKISIGTNIKKGPWGGGNLFAINLKEYLSSKGHIVLNNLNDPKIDLILITEPRKTSESSAFTHLDVQNYIKFTNSETLVMHRINECDERKGTNFVNKYLIEANKIADYTVFVSEWLKNLYEAQGINKKNNKVILAGANKEVFNPKDKAKWNQNNKLKIVTHHWGANWNKGFTIYEKIDGLLNNDFWKEKIEFTYIGNLPSKFKFINSRHIKPLSGKNLSDELKTNHIYLTGSLNEPSGNHHIEGAQCGLPVMYIDSGGVKEYCQDFGIEYTEKNIEEKLKYVLENYDNISERINNYPFNSDLMCSEFLNLFEEMLENKQAILNVRNSLDYGLFEKTIYKLKKNIKSFINQS
tara:strand:- start:1350 stop:2405 length:1056 start_codon:yes stop_codon:yes gene_type:complete